MRRNAERECRTGCGVGKTASSRIADSFSKTFTFPRSCSFRSRLYKCKTVATTLYCCTTKHQSGQHSSEFPAFEPATHGDWWYRSHFLSEVVALRSDAKSRRLRSNLAESQPRPSPQFGPLRQFRVWGGWRSKTSSTHFLTSAANFKIATRPLMAVILSFQIHRKLLNDSMSTRTRKTSSMVGSWLVLMINCWRAGIQCLSGLSSFPCGLEVLSWLRIWRIFFIDRRSASDSGPLETSWLTQSAWLAEWISFFKWIQDGPLNFRVVMCYKHFTEECEVSPWNWASEWVMLCFQLEASFPNKLSTVSILLCWQVLLFQAQYGQA